jgi:hypothetical protein
MQPADEKDHACPPLKNNAKNKYAITLQSGLFLALFFSGKYLANPY